MTTLHDSESLQSYGLRLQAAARRRDTRGARPAGSRLAPRLRGLTTRRSTSL